MPGKYKVQGLRARVRPGPAPRCDVVGEVLLQVEEEGEEKKKKRGGEEEGGGAFRDLLACHSTSSEKKLLNFGGALFF